MRIKPALFGAFALTCLWPYTLSAEPACLKTSRDHFVEILNDGEKRDGTGIVITSDGYILTAFHVVKGYLDTSVRVFNSRDPLEAEVVGVDDYFDLALLKVPARPGQLSPVPVARLNELSLDSSLTFCQWGYGYDKDAKGNPILDPLTGVETHFANKERGFVVFDRALKSGYSGGGTLFRGKLYGITLKRTIFGTGKTLPAYRMTSFLARHGLEITASGKIESTPGFSGILRQTRNNRALIDRILQSVSWKANFPYLEGQTSDHDLTIWFERNFPAQDIKGFFKGSATAYFKDQSFTQWLDQGNQPKSFDVSGEVRSNGTIVIRGFVNQVRSNLIEYLDNYSLQLDLTTLSALRIEGHIRSEVGRKLGGVRVKLTRQKPTTEP